MFLIIALCDSVASERTIVSGVDQLVWLNLVVDSKSLPLLEVIKWSP